MFIEKSTGKGTGSIKPKEGLQVTPWNVYSGI